VIPKSSPSSAFRARPPWAGCVATTDPSSRRISWTWAIHGFRPKRTLRRRIQILSAIVRLLIALLRALDVRLECTRLPDAAAKRRLLRAIDRAQDALSLRGALRVLHLSPSRYHQWRRAEQVCELDDQVSCSQSTPTRLTARETLTIKEMVESPEYRHVPTGRLAILAQRLGREFAAPATWYRLVRERGWCRPRTRVYEANRAASCGVCQSPAPISQASFAMG